MNIDEIQKEIERREKIGAKHRLNHNNRFTEKEMELITQMGCEDMTRSDTNSVYGIYTSMTIKAFIENRQDNISESLRRIMNEFEKQNPISRHSPEFEELIQI